MKYEQVNIGNLKSGLIIGDLHLSDTHRGRHKNYLENCFDCLGDLVVFAEKRKPDFIILTGDLVGVREKNIRARMVLLEICKILRRLQIITNDNLYVVRGNHDDGTNPEFDFLHGLGFFKTSQDKQYIDITSDDGRISSRIHLVDYGKEKEPINFCHDEGVSNIVVFHNNMRVKDQTTWYFADSKGFDLDKMVNWKGCELAIGGHIHDPSPYFVSTAIEGKEISLFYVGSPTRPIYSKDIYTSCWIASLKYNEEDGSTDFDTIKMELSKAEDIFYMDKFMEDIDDDDGAVAEKLRKEDLDSIIKDLVEYRIADGDPITMIKSMPNTKPRAVEYAVQYINLAYEQKASSNR